MWFFSAADFEDILVPRPDMLPIMESELKAVVATPLEKSWRFAYIRRYNETIERAECLRRGEPSNSLRRALHEVLRSCETIRPQHRARQARLGWRYRRAEPHGLPGGISSSVRLTTSQTHSTDPKHAGDGHPSGRQAPTQPAFRHNPYLSLYWLSLAKPSAASVLYAREPTGREEALKLTAWGAVVLTDDGKKGSPRPRPLADLAVSPLIIFLSPKEQISIWNQCLPSGWKDRLRQRREFSKTRAASAACENKLVLLSRNMEVSEGPRDHSVGYRTRLPVRSRGIADGRTRSAP